MIVECPQRELGCTYSCQRLLLSTHVDESCAYAEVTCPECNAILVRKDFAGHTHAETSCSEDTDPEQKPVSHEVCSNCRRSFHKRADHVLVERP